MSTIFVLCTISKDGASSRDAIDCQSGSGCLQLRLCLRRRKVDHAFGRAGELIRRAEQAPQSGSDSPRLQMNEHGYLEIMATGDPLTPEMVKEAAEDELV